METYGSVGILNDKADGIFSNRWTLKVRMSSLFSPLQTPTFTNYAFAANAIQSILCAKMWRHSYPHACDYQLP